MGRSKSPTELGGIYGYAGVLHSLALAVAGWQLQPLLRWKVKVRGAQNRPKLSVVTSRAEIVISRSQNATAKGDGDRRVSHRDIVIELLDRKRHRTSWLHLRKRTFRLTSLIVRTDRGSVSPSTCI